jgi:hypothetical protein
MLAPAGTSLTQERRSQHGRRPPLQRAVWRRGVRHTGRSTGTTTASTVTPANPRCALSPSTGPSGARVTLSCRGFAPSEQVDVSFGATVLTTAKATTSGQIAASFAVPSGFADSHYPGRRDTFQAKGRQRGEVASATFTVTG